MASDKQQGAVVEIVEYGGPKGQMLLPTKVYINGVDVGYVKSDSLDVRPGGAREPTEVTLTLLPRHVEITRRAAE